MSTAANPATALERVFSAISAGRMTGLPLCNPALGVEAVGFRLWLGVLITPWCINLMRLPGEAPKVGPMALMRARMAETLRPVRIGGGWTRIAAVRAPPGIDGVAPLRQGLRGLRADGIEAARVAAERLVQSLDPCVAYRLELTHA